MFVIFIIVDVTVSFKNPRYNVYENNGTLQLVLALSNPSSTDITIKVVNYDNTTMGKVMMWVEWQVRQFQFK